MAAATLANGDLFIHGGQEWSSYSSNKAQGDAWKLKFASNEWEQLQDGAEPKCFHSAFIVGPLVFILGGGEREGGKNEFSLA